MKTILCTTAMLLLVSGPLVAQREVNRSQPVSAPFSLSVRSGAGSVEIETGSGMIVSVTGTLAEGDSLEISEADRRLTLEIVGPESRRRDSGASTLKIRVPAGAPLEVTASDGDIRIAYRGGTVSAQTATGDITVDGAPRAVSARTISGDIRIRGPVASVLASSASGSIAVAEMDGFADLYSARGKVELRNSVLRQGTISTVDGDIVFDGDLVGAGVARFDSYAGAVGLSLDPERPLTFKLSTFGGAIENELGPPATDASRYAPGKELSFDLMGGGLLVEVETFSGDIRLKRRASDVSPADAPSGDTIN